MPSFRTKITGTATSPTGIVVPADVIAALGKGKKPPVIVTIDDTFTYHSTVGVMAGQSMIPLSAERRKAAGVKAQDEVHVTVELDTTVRSVELPSDFAAVLSKNEKAKQRFDALAPGGQKEYVRAIEDAKKPETRARRIESTIAKLTGE